MSILTKAKVGLKIEYNGKPSGFESEEFADKEIQCSLLPGSPLRKIIPLGSNAHSPLKRVIKPIEAIESPEPVPLKRRPKPQATIISPKPLSIQGAPWDKDDKNKCGECFIIFGTEADKNFRQNKKRDTEWIGCDRPRCKYWAHACCTDLILKGGVGIKDHSFLCPKHKKR